MELHNAIITLLKDKVTALNIGNNIGVITDSYNGILLDRTYDVKNPSLYEQYSSKHNVTYTVNHPFKMKSIESHDEDEMYYLVRRIDKQISVRLAEEVFVFNLNMEYLGEPVNNERKVILGLIQGNHYLMEYLENNS